MFVDRLIDAVKEKNNPSVVGLDPALEYVPARIREKAFERHGKGLKGAAEAILEFNLKIIDAVYDLVPAVKLQLAFYEMYGIDGIRVFQETARHARSKGLLVIGDGKRNDIGSTALAYSTAYLGKVTVDGDEKEGVFDVDALTVNPYLGWDGIKPFIDDCASFGKGIFILVKTSNPSSAQVQDLVTADGRSISEIVAGYVEEWGRALTGKYGYSSVGAVVGATYPEQAVRLRSIMKNSYILVPGYGAQGGSARDAAAAFNSDGLGAIVNASRSIVLAYRSQLWKGLFGEEEFDKAARAEAMRMRDDINKALHTGEEHR